MTQAKRDELIKQCTDEYEHALKYRQKREQEWRVIDDLYYGKKKKSLVTRANIHVPKMQGTIETFISKVDDVPYIHYEATEEGDTPKALKLNALLRRDMNIGDWDLKDILAKKEAALYGRTQFKKFSTNEDGFKDYLEVVASIDFLIDPLAGGLSPMDNANYMGQDNILRSKYQLESDIYDQRAVKRIVKQMRSDNDLDNRFKSHSYKRLSLDLSEAVLVSQDSVRLIEWYTTYQGERYYVLFSPECSEAVRVELLKDIFEDNEFPFVSWAPFPRIDEYWTPGLGELIKEPNIVQNILLSQMLDNTAFRNYGMKAYDINKIANPAELVPRPMGKIAVNGNPNEAVKDITFPDISQALSMYNSLENIYDKETGVTPQAKGMPHSKRMSATEFAGLLDEVADRFTTANKTYKHALRRLARLYKNGVEQNMTAATRIRILGSKGFEWQKVEAKDVKGDFDITISTGSLDEANKGIVRDRFMNYMKSARQNERLNQRFLDEKEARLMGFEEDEIQRLLDPEMEGDWEILAEAAQENEELITKEVKPNLSATQGHLQKHLDFLRQNNDLKPEQRARILLHVRQEIEPAIRNEELRASKMIAKQKPQPAPQAPAMQAQAPAMQAPQPNPQVL